MAKKIVKKLKKLSEEEKEELKAEGELPKKSVRDNENRQLMWFVIVIVVVFAAFLVPYFYGESIKSFELGGVDWQIEKLGDYDLYHGRFISISNQKLLYNIYFWSDPRTNMVETSGSFKDFVVGGYVSLDPRVEQCRDEYNSAIDMRGMAINLGAFLEVGLGLKKVDFATTDATYAYITGTPFINCNNVNDRSVVILKMGNESSVIKDAKNKNCYIITVKDCRDILPVEKFILTTISAFKEQE